jgi:hypothetical protein
MRIKMGFSRMSQWMVLALMLIYLVTGCGDLEPEMQNTRTVILNMDFDQRSSSRTSSFSPADLGNYKTHLIMVMTSENMVLTSEENLSNSNYLDYRSNQGEYVLYDSDREITLNMNLNTKMKIFAFLFSEKYSCNRCINDNPGGYDDLFPENQTAGYYGESESFTISRNLQTANITLNPVYGELLEDFDDTGGGDFGGDDFGGGDFGGDDFEGDNDTSGDTETGGGSNDTTLPLIEELSGITTPTTDTTPDYTFSSSEAGTITYGGSCATAGSATTAIVGHNLITYNTLSDGSYIDCTITVTDSAGNVSNPLSVTPFTVNTTVTNDTIDTTLLAHYAFEGNLFDNSSYNRHLTEVGSNITYSAADNTSNKSGRAALFNGTNTYAYTDNITLSDNFTVAFWTKPDSPNMVQWNSALSTGNSTNSGRFQIDFNTTDNGSIRFCAGSCSMTTTLNSNVWNHIVITKTHGNGENKKVSLYTGGSLRDNQSDITTRWDMIKLGLNRSGGGYWNGYLDEVKIYNRTFSAQEVIDLYESY